MASKAKQYHESLQHTDCDLTEQPDPTKLNNILENITTRTTPKQKNDLTKYMNRSEVHRAVKDQANDKAAGLDGILIKYGKKWPFPSTHIVMRKKTHTAIS
jgi:hypothetical protein